jgi:uncharacterized protein YcbK (DUF882 family)
MTQSVKTISPPVNYTISRRRILRMGALAVAAGVVPYPALALPQGSAKSDQVLARHGKTPGKARYTASGKNKTTRRTGAVARRKRQPAGTPGATVARGDSLSTQSDYTAARIDQMPSILHRHVFGPERSLDMYNSHTGESLHTVYWVNGRYLRSALRETNFLLRDHHSDEVTDIDPELLNLLYHISTILETYEPIHVISAYRSPSTNTMLRLLHRGVAEHSWHTHGKAVDIRVPGTSARVVRQVAIALGGGGVGYYPWSNYVHIDTGPVRYW